MTKWLRRGLTQNIYIVLYNLRFNKVKFLANYSCIKSKSLNNQLHIQLHKIVQGITFSSLIKKH